MLENEFAAKLHRAWTVVAGDRSEVPIVGAGIDSLEVYMVERIEGLETQLNSRPFVRGDWDALEQGEIPVEDSRSHDRVLPRAAKALIRASRPGSGWIGIRTGAEPGGRGLGISDL